MTETIMGCFMVLAFIILVAAIVACWIENLKQEITDRVLEQLYCDNMDDTDE